MSNNQRKMSDSNPIPLPRQYHLNTTGHIGNDLSNSVHSTDPVLEGMEEHGPGRDALTEDKHNPENRKISNICARSKHCTEFGNEARTSFSAAKLAFLKRTSDHSDADTRRGDQLNSTFAHPGKHETTDSHDIHSRESQPEISLQERKNDDANLGDNQSWKSVSNTSIAQTNSDIEPQDNPLETTPETNALVEDECLQFTRNFKLALEQAEARDQQSPSTNTKTFQPLRRATKRISNRIQFLQDQLQHEVTSGFANKKSIERLKKQLIEAEEMSANFQTIRKHQRSVSRSGRPMTKTRHSTTPGKRERPYRHWVGFAKVVTPGPDSRFIISSKDDRQSKACSVDSNEAPHTSKTFTPKRTARKEIDVHRPRNNIVEYPENTTTSMSQTGSPETLSQLDKSNYDENTDVTKSKDSVQDVESSFKINKDNPNSNIAVHGKKESVWKIAPSDLKPRNIYEQNIIDYSISDSRNVYSDLANAMERLDLKRGSASNACDGMSKPIGFNHTPASNLGLNTASPDMRSPRPDSPLISSETFLVNFDGYKTVNSDYPLRNKDKHIEQNPFTVPLSFTRNNDDIPTGSDNSIAQLRLDDPHEPFSYSQAAIPIINQLDDDDLPKPGRRNTFVSPFCDVKQSPPASFCKPFTSPLKPNEGGNGSPPHITKKRFTSPHYVPKSYTASRAYHPRPPGYSGNFDTQGRLRRHKERSSSRMAARTGSRSLARQHRPRGLAEEPEVELKEKLPSAFTDDVDKEIDAIHQQADGKKPVRHRSEKVVSSYSMTDRDINKTLEAASRARLMQRIRSVRRIQKGTKYYINVMANQDFVGKLPGQLSFRAGQAIKLRCPDVDPPDGQCYGYYRRGRLRTKKRGLFPMSCVELQSEMQTAL